MELTRAISQPTRPEQAELNPSVIGAVLTGVATAVAIEILRPPRRPEITIVVEDNLE